MTSHGLTLRYHEFESKRWPCRKSRAREVCEVILSLYARSASSDAPEIIPHELRYVMVVMDHLCMLELQKMHACIHVSVRLGQFAGSVWDEKMYVWAT